MVHFIGYKAPRIIMSIEMQKTKPKNIRIGVEEKVVESCNLSVIKELKVLKWTQLTCRCSHFLVDREVSLRAMSCGPLTVFVSTFQLGKGFFCLHMK